MNKCATRYLVLVLVLVPLSFWAFSVDIKAPLSNLSSLYFPETVTPEELQEKYNRQSLNVLIVPGHDNDSWGTEFGGLKESELNVALGVHLFNLFLDDPKFNVSLLRNSDGEYSPWFQDYMTVNEDAIQAFRDASREEIRQAKQDGRFKEAHETVVHNPAADNTSLYLYGINKYANDFGVDIVLHIHFNDYPGRRWNKPGEYSGFSIYVPEGELPNSRASTELAYSVKEKLEIFTNPSTFPGEYEIVIPDQELIAVGSNASRDRISILIEYGYIYESRYHDKALRALSVKELAHLTYSGIKEYYRGAIPNKSSLLPYAWRSTLKQKDKGPDVLALQVALGEEGVYPPRGDTLKTCPISGYYGSCTKRAITEFQEKYETYTLEPLGLDQGTGIFGARTQGMMNALYGEDF